MTIENRASGLTDPGDMLRSAFKTFVNASIDAFAAWIDREHQRGSDGAPASDDESESAAAIAEAASLLGVSRIATVDEIRAAFRQRVKGEMKGGGFHDQGGDETDEHAQRLIAAKNLLIAHATASEVAHGQV
jgi:hypothetical protein